MSIPPGEERDVRVASIDGEILPPSNAVISVYDRGFLYGDSVFDVLRVYGGVPFALGEHVARLKRSAERALMRMPIDEKGFIDEVRAAIDVSCMVETQKARGEGGDRYVRMMITRGSGPLGYDLDACTNPRRCILVEALTTPPIEHYKEGIRLLTIPTVRATDGTLAAGAKYANYLASILAMHEARRHGASEAVILGAHGKVLEGATSNVFVVRGGRITTPPETDGILAGITRAHVIAIAGDLAIPLACAELAAHDLYDADEVFITSSIREIVPAIEVDGRLVGRGAPGPTTRAIHVAYRARATGSAPSDRRAAGRPGASGRMPWEG